ncbi:MAG: DUF1501 domain-containing protein [Isosphaeraceae bacterium]
MIKVMGGSARTCDGTTRRDVLRAGGLSLFGSMTLPRLLQAREAQGNKVAPRARSVLLVNLFGGPSHLDMFDMKPNAPLEVRGEFRPIDTSVPGLQICEHMPRLSRWMHKATLIRSVTHRYNSHNPYAMLTGFDGGNDRENYYTQRTDHPGISAVCQYLGLGPEDLPGSVFLPALPGYSQGLRRAGPYGGYLGRQFDPMFADCDPKFEKEFDQDKSFYDPVPPFGSPRLPTLEATPELTVGRFRSRTGLLAEVDRRVSRFERSREYDTMDHFQRKAIELLTSSRARAAFDVSREPEAVRRAYGDSLFGTSLLVGRRLVEAGVTFVGVTTESRGGGHWDSHAKNFSMLKTFNLPNLDEIVSALVADLNRTGLLDTTLVAVMGEMGRAPKVNGQAGRDHWPQCGFALFFGGGVKEGFVLGASDKLAAYPTERPVTPGDVIATMYQLLGVDPTLTVPDLTGRPVHVAHGGVPVREVLA